MRIVLVASTLFLLTASSSRPYEMRMVEYDIDGTANYADVTWTNGTGSTEQKQVKFPFHESFAAPLGMVAYVSAQKAVVKKESIFGIEVVSDGKQGTVHVAVHINSQLRGEATSDAPFGIAKVSAKVE